jgi:hypothetical protein
MDRGKVARASVCARSAMQSIFNVMLPDEEVRSQTW